MSNTIGSSRESNPSCRICDLRAVSLDQAADVSRFLKSIKDLQEVIIGDICVGAASSLCRIMSKALWVENENLQKIIFVLGLRDIAPLLS